MGPATPKPMTLINVTKTQLGSPDGIQTINYQAGQQYEMPEPLAEVFVEQGWGTEATAKADPEALEEPDILEDIDEDPHLEPAEQSKPETARQPKKQYK